MRSVRFFFASAAFAATMTTATVRQVPVTFSPTTNGMAIIRDQMQGTCLPIWNSKQLYEEIKPSLEQARYTLLRFPNGSLSNDYHWNGKGSYDANGVWWCDSIDYSPGFVSQLKYRGTSKDHYGFSGVSAVTDGDTATFWWSDPNITGTRPYFYLEFSPSTRADSIVIHWVRHYGVDFVVQRWPAPSVSYPGPHQAAADLWITVDSVTGAAGGVYSSRIDTGDASGYFRVLVHKTSGDSGWRVREVYLFNKNTQVSRNVKSYAENSTQSQTKVVALGTHSGSMVRPDWASGWVTWDFESFMPYCASFPYTVIPLICVNYGTGTPEEAAAWVWYANKVKGYGIRFWQVGNEMDGLWEEGGPVTAAMYAERFLAFSKAMKTVDPTIKVLGPVLSTADFYSQSSGEYDGLTWMESFLKRVAEQERADAAVYLDGIDIHSYPYYFSTSPNPAIMLDKSDLLWSMADSLKAMIYRRLPNPDSVYVCLSEFNMSVTMASILQEPINGICVANLYATLAEKFGSRAMSVVWDSYENLSSGPNGTWGSLSLLTPPSGKALSTPARSPSSIYWPLFMAGRLWLLAGAENRISPVLYDRKSKIRAFGVSSQGSFRALLLNLSNDTVRVPYTMADSTYDEVDVYSWSGRDYLWNGTGHDAFAMPNCGPSSFRIAADSLDTIMLLPLSSTVAVWHNHFDDTVYTPQLLQTIRSAQKVRGKDSLKLWGTAMVAGNAFIERVTLSVDNATPIAVPALDGSFNGPSESWFFSLAAKELGMGTHRIIVSAHSSAGATAIDTFSVTGGDTLRPIFLVDNFEDRNLISLLPSGAAWERYHAGTSSSYLTLSIDSSGAAGTGAVLRADFSIEKPPTLPYDVYGAVGVSIDTVWMDTVRQRPKGITFRYASAHSNAGGTFILQVQSNPVKDYDYFTIPLANTNGAWRTVTMEWADIRQEGWGKHIDSLSARQIMRLEFRTVKDGRGYLLLDNIAFVSDSDEPVLPAKLALRPAAGGQQLRVSPVANGRVIISWPMSEKTSVSVRIYNPRGVLVHAANHLRPGTASYCWRRGSTAGMYVVRVHSGATVLGKRFCVAR